MIFLFLVTHPLNIRLHHIHLLHEPNFKIAVWEKKTWIIGILLYLAIPLINYLATKNNFVDSKRDDVSKILMIYLV